MTTPARRADILIIGDDHFAVVKEAGKPDVILDGADGRPQPYPTAYAALSAARKAIGEAVPVRVEDGIRAWRRDRDRRLAEERARMFGKRGERT
jgi:hypothetical protein